MEKLVIVHHPAAEDQSAFRLSLALEGASVQIDDTVFSSSPFGTVLVSDRLGETIYAISKDVFSPAAAYPAGPTSVGKLDLDTGVLTNVVTGMAVRTAWLLFLTRVPMRISKGGSSQNQTGLQSENGVPCLFSAPFLFGSD